MLEQFKKRIIIVNLFLISILFILLQLTNPKFFLSGDSKVQFFPIIVAAGENLLHGTLPQINLSQYLGLPVIEKSYYGLLYLPTYISYFVSKYILMDITWTIDTFVYIHLIGAGIFLTILFRYLDISPTLNTIGVLSYIFTSANLFMAEWYYIYPTIMFMPLFVYIILKLIKEFSYQWFLILCITFGVFYFAGNIQLVFYSFIYILPLIMIIFVKNFTRKKLLFILLISISIVGLILPNLLLTYDIGKLARPEKFSMSEYIGMFSNEPVKHIKSMYWPNTLTHEKFEVLYRSDHRYTMAYIGLIPFIGILIGMVYWIFRVNNKKYLYIYFLIAGLVSLIFVFGDKTPIYPLLYKIPIWNQLRSAMKHILFSNFFLIVFGIISLNSIFKLIEHRWQLRNLKVVNLFLIILTFLLIQLNISSISHITGKGTHDGSGLEEDLFKKKYENVVSDGRVASFSGGLFSTHNYNIKYIDYLGFNYAALSNLLTIGGYDVLIEKSIFNTIFKSNWYSNFFEPKEIEYFKNYGLKYIIFPSILRVNDMESMIGTKVSKIVYKDQSVQVVELHNSTPIVFNANQNIPFKVNYQKNTVTANLSQISFSNDVTFNFIYHLGFKVKDEFGKSYNIEKDSMNRVVAKNISIDSKVLVLSFNDFRSIISFYCSSLLHLLLISILFILFIRRIYGNQKTTFS